MFDLYVPWNLCCFLCTDYIQFSFLGYGGNISLERASLPFILLFVSECYTNHLIRGTEDVLVDSHVLGLSSVCHPQEGMGLGC